MLLDGAIYHFCKFCGCVWFEYMDAHQNWQQETVGLLIDQTEEMQETATDNPKSCGCNQ